MKKMIKITAFISALVMAASAFSCSGRKPAAATALTSKGGYVEEKMQFAYGDLGNVSEFVNIGGKTGTIMPYTNELCYISKEGDRVFRDVLDGLDSENDDDIYNIYAASEHGFLVQKESGPFFIGSDGSTKQISGFPYFQTAEFTEDGKLFASSYDAIYEIDTENGSTAKIADIKDWISAFDIINGDLIYIDGDGAHCCDTAGGTAKELPEALESFLSGYKPRSSGTELLMDMCSGRDNDIYIGCPDGLYRYINGGNLVEQLMDGYISRFGDPSDTLVSITCGEDGTVFGAFFSGMYSYRFDPELETAITSELKVYSLEDSATVNKLISNFAADNRNIKVDHQVGMKDGMTYSDAMKELTTQILSGSAPDIMILDGLDTDNLAEKNMLEDLAACEDKWRPEGGLLTNITDWDSRGGKLYSAACRFRIPAVGAEESVLKKIDSYADLADICEENRKKHDPKYTLMDYFDMTDPIRIGLMYEGNELLGNGPDKERFAEFFDTCERLYNNDKCLSDENAIWYSRAGDENMTTDCIFTSRYTLGFYNDYILATGAVSSITDDINVLTSSDEADAPIKTAYRFGIGEDSRSFLPVCQLGIVQSCKNRDAALKFLAYAFDEDAQETGNYYDGFPVNEKALKWFYDKNMNVDNDFFMGISSSMDGEAADAYESLEVKCMDNDEVKTFDSYIRSLDKPVYINYADREIIETAGTKCIEGTVTAEQAAEDTVKQLELRMKE